MTSPIAIRSELLKALEADLVGPFLPEGHPGAGEEVLPLAPSRWYLTGFLAPQTGRMPDKDDTDSEDEGLAAGGESKAEDAGNTEPEAKRRQYFPASMGLSVFLPPGTVDGSDHIEVVVSWADYGLEEIQEDRSDKTKRGWRRVPRGPFTVKVPLDARQLSTSAGVRWPESSGMCLRGELRTTDMDGLAPGTRLLSLFLVNDRVALDKDRDLNFAFQVGMTLRYRQGAGFIPRPNRRGEDSVDADQRVLALLFRDKVEWAVGHNTSLVCVVPDGDGRVTELSTTQLPSYAVKGVRHESVEGIVTGMRELSEMDGPALRNALTPLIEKYASWIERQNEVHLERDELSKTRKELMKLAGRARERMAEGIELLAISERVRTAFKWANLAMDVAARQADKWREDPRYKGDKVPRWRPFQLAFVLLNLASIGDPHHSDRKVADLIYFPTGGGKTEAYLGLIAFTLLLRRLDGRQRDDEGRGVAVILRYTLRLLTLDQLGRAATLICALEEMRNKQPKVLGNKRFSVGLWVGKAATANLLKDVHAALNDYTPGQAESPFPLTSCPWCGTDIKIQDIKLVDDSGRPSKTKYTRAVVYCEGSGCLFSEKKRFGQGLPVVFVDEQITRSCPTSSSPRSTNSR